MAEQEEVRYETMVCTACRNRTVAGAVRLRRAQAPAPGSSQGAPASAVRIKPENRSVGLCIGLTRYPLHQIVQLGFLEKAEELGYEGHVLGLEEGLMQGTVRLLAAGRAGV